MFSKTHCPYCQKVRNLFAEMNIDYKTFELDKEENGSAIQDELQRISGQRTVPNVFIKGIHVGGSDVVLKLSEEGKLKNMIQ